jgi:hypothetical protein
MLYVWLNIKHDCTDYDEIWDNILTVRELQSCNIELHHFQWIMGQLKNKIRLWLKKYYIVSNKHLSVFELWDIK